MQIVAFWWQEFKFNPRSVVPNIILIKDKDFKIAYQLLAAEDVVWLTILNGVDMTGLLN